MPDGPANIKEHYKQSYRSFKAGEWEQALAELRLCLKQNPLKRKYSRLYSQIAAQLIAQHYQQEAETLHLQGRFAELINNYQRAVHLKIYPRHFRQLIRQTRQFQQWVMDMYQQAGDLLTQEKLTKARRKAQELLEHTPQWLEPQKLLAKIEQREQAQDLYTKANSLYRDGKYEDARWLLEQSQELDQDYSAPQVLLSRIKEKLGQPEHQIIDAAAEHSLPLAESVLLLEEGAEIFRVDNELTKKPAKRENQPKGK